MRTATRQRAIQSPMGTAWLVIDGDRLGPATGGEVWGRWSTLGLLEGPTAPGPGERLVASAGAVRDEADPARAAMYAWGEAGRRLLDASVERALSGGGEVLIRGACGELLSDVPGCLSLLRRFEGTGLRLAVDPGAMLSDEMTRDADDHATRVIEALLPHPAAGLLIVRADRPGLAGVMRCAGVIRERALPMLAIGERPTLLAARIGLT